jgi:uncharacterized protein YbjT (DUF2867 family)
MVGQILYQKLAEDGRITGIDLVGRRAVARDCKKTVQHIGPVSDWPTFVSQTRPDVAISTLGTTIRDAGSEAAFAAIDFDAAICFARAAAGAGAHRFQSVSSVGAHPGSRNFYLATKGKAEAELKQIGFDRLDLMRPGLLRGHRVGRVRVGEKIGMMISPLTDLLTPRVIDHYRSIAAEKVASAMHALVHQDSPGVFTHEYRSIMELAAQNA